MHVCIDCCLCCSSTAWDGSLQLQVVNILHVVYCRAGSHTLETKTANKTLFSKNKGPCTRNPCGVIMIFISGKELCKIFLVYWGLILKEWKDVLFRSRGKHGCIIRAINHVLKAGFLLFIPQKTLSFSIYKIITENTFCIHTLKISRKKTKTEKYSKDVGCFGLADVSMKECKLWLCFKNLKLAASLWNS